MIEVIKGDITKVSVDIIVNAANTSLLGGGGVDGAIHKAGGPGILEECRKIRNKQGGCKVGEAVVTSAGNLSAKYVIHAVGPVWYNGKSDEIQLLENAYTNSLKLATEYNAEHIAFPNISTGIYRFPKKKAAEIAISAVVNFLSSTSRTLNVLFVCFDQENFNIYDSLLKSSLK